MLNFTWPVLALHIDCLRANLLQPFNHIAKMQRPRRSAKPVTFYDDKLAQEEEVAKKARLETSKKRRANPLQPVAVEKLPEPLQATQQDPLPEFTPPFRITYQSFRLRYTPYSPLAQFCSSFLCIASIALSKIQILMRPIGGPSLFKNTLGNGTTSVARRS